MGYHRVYDISQLLKQLRQHGLFDNPEFSDKLGFHLKDEFDIKGLSVISKFGVLAACQPQICNLQIAPISIQSCKAVLEATTNLNSLALDTKYAFPRDTINLPAQLESLTLIDGDCKIDGQACNLTDLTIHNGRPELVLSNTRQLTTLIGHKYLRLQHLHAFGNLKHLDASFKVGEFRELRKIHSLETLGIVRPGYHPLVDIMEVVDSNPNLRGIIVSQAPCPGFDAQTSKNAMDGLLAYLPRLQVLETRFTASYTVVTDTGYDAHKALYNCEGLPQRQAIPQVRKLVVGDSISILGVENWRNFPNLKHLVLKEVTGTEPLKVCHQYLPVVRLAAGLQALEQLEVTLEHVAHVQFASSSLKYLKVGPVCDYEVVQGQDRVAEHLAVQIDHGMGPVGAFVLQSTVNSLAPFCERLQLFCDTDTGLETGFGVDVMLNALCTEHCKLPKRVDLYQRHHFDTPELHPVLWHKRLVKLYGNAEGTLDRCCVCELYVHTGIDIHSPSNMLIRALAKYGPLQDKWVYDGNFQDVQSVGTFVSDTETDSDETDSGGETAIQSSLEVFM